MGPLDTAAERLMLLVNQVEGLRVVLCRGGAQKSDRVLSLPIRPKRTYGFHFGGPDRVVRLDTDRVYQVACSNGRKPSERS